MLCFVLHDVILGLAVGDGVFWGSSRGKNLSSHPDGLQSIQFLIQPQLGPISAHLKSSQAKTSVRCITVVSIRTAENSFQYFHTGTTKPLAISTTHL